MNTPKTREDFKWARRFLRDGCIDDREYRIRMLNLIEDIIQSILPDVAPVCNNGEWTVDNTRLRDEVQRLKTKSDYLTARNEELERVLKETRENLARTEDARVHLDNNVTTLRKNIKDLGSSYDALLKEHDRLKADKSHLGHNYEKVVECIVAAYAEERAACATLVDCHFDRGREWLVKKIRNRTSNET